MLAWLRDPTTLELLEKCIHHTAANPIENKILKFIEEFGELASLILACREAPNRSASAVEQLGRSPTEVLEEMIDVFTVAVDCLGVYRTKCGFSDEELLEILERKLQKWLSKPVDRVGVSS